MSRTIGMDLGDKPQVVVALDRAMNEELEVARIGNTAKQVFSVSTPDRLGSWRPGPIPPGVRACW
jgi:hypothetical protein